MKLQNSLLLNSTRLLCVFVCICKYIAGINAIFIMQSGITLTMFHVHIPDYAVELWSIF